MGAGAGRTGGAQASRSGSLSSSFRLCLLLHLHPVLLCASRSLHFLSSPCARPLFSLLRPVAVRARLRAPRGLGGVRGSCASPRSSLPPPPPIFPAKRGSQPKGPPRPRPSPALPGARRAIKRQPWPLGPWPPRLAASAPGRERRARRHPGARARGFPAPRAGHLRLPPGPRPDSARRRGTKAGPTPPSLAGARGEQGERHAGPARSRRPPAAPGPAAVAGCGGPGRAPG